MGLLDRIEGKTLSSRDLQLNEIGTLYGGGGLFGGRRNASGQNVNWRTALQVSTVLACARVYANGLAQVPFKLIKESADGKTKLPAKDHPLYDLLHRRPNFFQTSFEYRETLAFHLVLAGAHYSFINRVRGDIYELLPFEPQCVEVKRDAKTLQLSYKITPPNGGAPETFPAEGIWHVRGPSWNGWHALPAVQLAREAIGLAMATEEGHAKLHRNAARVGGLISVEGALTEKQYNDMHKWVKEHFINEGAYSTMILDRGSKFTSAAQSGVESQHLETRKYQVEEVCRSCGVMPIMVGYSDKAPTYASAEQLFLAHVVHTLAPMYERVEQSAAAQLLTDKDRKDGISPKFIAEGLLRGQLKDTKDYLLGLVNGGVMKANEARDKLDLDPDSDPASNKLRVPVNLTVDPGSLIGNDPTPKKE
jgi:HK97 family phage portal protein